MSYIPLIRQTSWIDLSLEHKKLRLELENSTHRACVDKEQGIAPIMLKGAFGIGKTNSLYYLFHYCWCILKTPAFFVSLKEDPSFLNLIAEFAATHSSKKIENSKLGPFINEIISKEIKALKNGEWDNMPKIYFPEFKGGNLNSYLKDSSSVKIIGDSVEHTLPFPVTFSKEVIEAALVSGNRPVLLIDEFEYKFYDIKKHIEIAGGGGVLTALFDQIVQDTEMFYLVIGNGPASGLGQKLRKR
jgi:hypothetical protein